MKRKQQPSIPNKVFELNNFTYYYPHHSKPSLHQVSLEVNEGEFLLLIGRSGSGKSTLARALCGLVPDFYGGSVSGDILYQGVSLNKWAKSQLAGQIGIVFQEPDSQLFYRNVERDIAFGLENLGLPNSYMQRRVAEMMDFLNLNALRKRDSSTLSGGEKQKIALAGVLAMNPRVLILDEPTSQLDPVATGEFLKLVKDLNDEYAITIILIEQRLEQSFPLADRVLILEEGKIIFQGDSREELRWAAEQNYPLMPVIPALFARVTNKDLPLTIKEGRKLLSEFGLTPYPEVSHRDNENGKPGQVQSGVVYEPDKEVTLGERSRKPRSDKGKPLVEIKRLSFTYPHGGPALRDVNLNIWLGECVALVGANGAGKSTLLQIMAGLLPVNSGYARVGDFSGKDLKAEKVNRLLGYLPQNLNNFFLADTVSQDIALNSQIAAGEVDFWLDKMNLQEFREDDPRKLSTGEKHRVAMAALLGANPDLILLDEPTTGLDGEQKKEIGELLLKLCQQNKSVLLVTHDIDFASEYAGRLVFMHNGTILADGSVQEVMAGNTFYTSQAARLFWGIEPGIINQTGAIEFLGSHLSKLYPRVVGQGKELDY